MNGATAGAAFIASYFDAEKSESLLFMLLGAGFVLLALLHRRRRWRGMVGPLIAIAAIQLIVGYTVYARTDAQVAALRAQLAADPAAFRREETPRMLAVVANFELYKRIEIVLFAAGLVLAAVMRRRGDYWLAFGLALALQSAIMLGLDRFSPGVVEGISAIDGA